MMYRRDYSSNCQRCTLRDYFCGCRHYHTPHTTLQPSPLSQSPPLAGPPRSSPGSDGLRCKLHLPPGRRQCRTDQNHQHPKPTRSSCLARRQQIQAQRLNSLDTTCRYYVLWHHRSTHSHRRPHRLCPVPQLPQRSIVPWWRSLQSHRWSTPAVSSSLYRNPGTQQGCCTPPCPW